MKFCVTKPLDQIVNELFVNKLLDSIVINELLINEPLVNELIIENMVNKPYVNFDSNKRQVNQVNELLLLISLVNERKQP